MIKTNKITNICGDSWSTGRCLNCRYDIYWIMIIKGLNLSKDIPDYLSNIVSHQATFSDEN